MKGVMKVMLLKKLRMVAGAVMVMVALGAIGLGYHAGDTSAPRRRTGRGMNWRRCAARTSCSNSILKSCWRRSAQEAELQSARKQLAANADATKATLMDERIYPLIGPAGDQLRTALIPGRERLRGQSSPRDGI